MRPLRRYSLSISSSTDNTQLSDTNTNHDNIIPVGENLPLTPKTSKLSNIRHTKEEYHHKFDCSYFKPCICNPIVVFGLILLIVIVPTAITVGGYFTVEAGIKKNNYADSFNIEGSCTVTYANVIYVQKTCTRTYQECSRRRLYGSSGSGSGSSYGSSNNDEPNCVTKTETYDCSYYYTTVDYIVNEDTNSTIFPCAIGTEFNEQYDGRHYEYEEGQKRACYTNPSCDEIFTDTKNRHHSSAGWIYFGASVVFLVAICCLGGICYFWRDHVEDVVGKCRDSRDDCCDGWWCLCVEYKGYRDGKDEHYKYQWDKVMNDDDRFDYVMSNWMKKYGKYRYKGVHDEGISVDIETIIYDYLY